MSQTTKVYEFAKDLGMETMALMDKIRKWDMPIKSHMASLDEEMVKDIKEKLAAESGTAEEATVTKKKAKKKTAAKKKVAKKATAKKKVVKKKTVIKKTITKKTAEKEAAQEDAEAKEAAPKRTVIRRKAADKEKEAQLAKEKAEQEIAEAALRAEQEQLAAEQSEVIEVVVEPEAQPESVEASSDEEVAPVAPPEGAKVLTPASPARKSMVSGRNIVGKIDLSKTMRPPRAASAGNARVSEVSSEPRSGAQRNIRTGFVAAPPMPSMLDLDPRRVKEERTPKKKGVGAKESQQTQVNFTSSDFRKREVIFQPKKKRNTLSRDSKKTEITVPKASKRVVKLYGEISVSDLANEMKLKAPQLTKVLIKEGVMANMNTMLDFDTVSLIVGEFGFEAENLSRSEDEIVQSVAFGDLDADLVARPPVVTVMGHVDHGKTTLLDTIRKANVARGEAGGITQHIGAYSVQTELGEITFIDTPGHAAFTAMRERGANVTDIAIIIVAADDGIMPQTEEAISHAKAAGVPIIVAVNKMDREGANPERIKQQLTEFELVPEEWGGSTIFCPVSALEGTGISELLEQITLLAEVQELKANPKRSATGVIIESKMEKGRGCVASVLVKDGTLNVGDIIAAGKVVGKVRSMTNDKGQRVKSVGPGQPVEITGLPESPVAGDMIDVCKTEALAAELVQHRKEQEEQAEVPNSKMSLDQIFAKVKQGNLSELPLILKGDGSGSIEAIKASLVKLGTDEVQAKIIHSAVGGVSESDVILGSTAGAIILAFNSKADAAAQRLAKEKGVEIKTYSIIYELLDDMKVAMSGLLSPDLIERALGTAEVRDVFSVPRIGTIAGCYVLDGKVQRGAKVRLMRAGELVHEGVMDSLKRFKDDAKEVASGYECGIGIENFNDVKVGDIIETFKVDEVARTLE